MKRYIYVERGGFMLHLYLCREYPNNCAWRWGYALRIRDRYVLFGGRR